MIPGSHAVVVCDSFASAERLPLSTAVLTYRDQIVQEHIFRRLHGKVNEHATCLEHPEAMAGCAV